VTRGAAPQRRPIGRRPGDPDDTRRAILAAAQGEFGANGYDRATIRAIATRAGVDPGLVIHHFRNKQELFAAAHELPVNPARLFDEVARLPRHEWGEAMARAYLTVLAAPGSPAFSLLRAAATNADAAAMLREFIQDAAVARGAELIGGPDAELRLALAASQLIGIAVARELIGMPQLNGRDLDDIVAAVAPTIQRYVDGR
jgi:AcrR family transcriptional regulator